MNVGLVGAGPWAQLFTAPLIEETDGLRLAGVWTRSPQAARAQGWPVFSSYEELLGHCDAVAFAVPPDVQAEMAARAAAFGCHVLLDKPIAKDVHAAEELAAAVAGAGVVSQVLLTNRYMSTTREFLKTASDGEVLHVSCSLISGAVLKGSSFATPWRVAESHPLLDLGPHAFDLVTALAGSVVEIRASVYRGVLSARLVHASGCVSDVTLSSSTPETSGPLTCEVVASSGRWSLPNAGYEGALLARREAGRQFAASCRGETTQPLDAQHGLALQRLLDRVDHALSRT